MSRYGDSSAPPLRRKQKKDMAGVTCLLLFYYLFSTGVSWGPDNGTTLRDSFCLWVQPTNTDVKNDSPTNWTLHTHKHTYIHTYMNRLTQSLTQAPRVKLTDSLYAHYSSSHSLRFTHNRIHSEEKQNSQSIIRFGAFV